MLFPTDAGDRLLTSLRSGKPALCAYVFSHPNLVEVAGLAGFDCFMADMMFTALDWDQIAGCVPPFTQGFLNRAVRLRRATVGREPRAVTPRSPSERAHRTPAVGMERRAIGCLVGL